MPINDESKAGYGLMDELFSTRCGFYFCMEGARCLPNSFFVITQKISMSKAAPVIRQVIKGVVYALVDVNQRHWKWKF